MYAIMGATGHVGNRIARHLLNAGRPIRVIGRRRETLQPLIDLGAEARVGDANDVEFLTRAFRGATGAFVLTPPKLDAPDFRLYQKEFGSRVTEAIAASGIRKVINLSSMGADHAKGTGPIAGLYDQEQRLNRIAEADILHLRPTYFLENLFANIPLIKSQGINGSLLKRDLEFQVVATKDIGDVAAEWLLEPTFEGKSELEIFGPRKVTPTEITRALGATIGKPDLAYVEFSAEETEAAMVGSGLTSDLAHLFIEMMQAMNRGLMTEPGGPFVRRSTSLEEFAKEFAIAYRNT